MATSVRTHVKRGESVQDFFKDLELAGELHHEVVLHSESSFVFMVIKTGETIMIVAKGKNKEREIATIRKKIKELGLSIIEKD